MKKPIRFIILKIVGFVGVAVLIAGIVLAINGFGDFESNNFMIGNMVIIAHHIAHGTFQKRFTRQVHVMFTN